MGTRIHALYLHLSKEFDFFKKPKISNEIGQIRVELGKLTKVTLVVTVLGIKLVCRTFL